MVNNASRERVRELDRERRRKRLQPDSANCAETLTYFLDLVLQDTLTDNSEESQIKVMTMDNSDHDCKHNGNDYDLKDILWPKLK